MKELLLATMARYAFVIAYNGTPFHGWQKQPNAPTIQQSIQEVLSNLLQQNIDVVGCGRTDTGVHASYYPLHFDFFGGFPMEDIAFKLNGLLPSTIVVKEVYEVKDDFHARFHATERTYTYRIHQSKNPFLIDLSWFMRHSLNIEAMNNAASRLLTVTDFESFCKSGSDQENTLCNLTQATWIRNADQLEFKISANRFLRNMVRAIVGTLIDVGLGKISISEFNDIVDSKNRSAAGKSVPGCGLYLSNVNYPSGNLLNRIDRWEK